MNEFLTFFADCGLIDPDGITTKDLKEAINDIVFTAVGLAISGFIFCLVLANL